MAAERASATSTQPRPRALLLLDVEVHVVGGSNATTAEASSLGGHGVVTTAEASSLGGVVITAAAATLGGHGDVAVTLHIADPSQLLPVATVRIRCSDPSTLVRHARVVGAEASLLLISARFHTRPARPELFLFDYERVVLMAIPAPPLTNPSTFKFTRRDLTCFAVLPGGLGSGVGFLLAAVDYLGDSSKQTMLVFSLEDFSWASKSIPNPPWPVSSFSDMKPHKAIAVGEKQALWADLDQGQMLLCDFNRDPPVFKYFLAPLCTTSQKVEELIIPTFSVGLCRDVSFAEGLIKVVELQNHVAFTYQPQHPNELSQLSDQGLIASKKRSCPGPGLVCTVNRWRMVMSSRTVAAESWGSQLVVDVADTNLMLQSADGLTYDKMHSHMPTIVLDGDDSTVYFKAVHNFGDDNGYLLSIDMHSKILKSIAFLPSSPTDRDHCPRLISKVHGLQ